MGNSITTACGGKGVRDALEKAENTLAKLKQAHSTLEDKANEYTAKCVFLFCYYL